MILRSCNILNKPSLRRIWGLFVFALACAVSGEALAGNVPYHVGPGDVLQIQVWREDDLSGNYAVTPKGAIQFPLLGEVQVAGKNPQQIKNELTEALETDYLVKAVVTVAVGVYQSHKVFVFGHIGRPGLYYLKEDPSLLKILLEAGGPASGGVRSASILRFHDTPAEGKSPLEHLKIDLNALFTAGDLSQDINLQTSDIVFVSPAGGIESDPFVSTNSIYVLGEVKNPGTFAWKEGYTALNAVLDAGGLTEFAAGNRVRLVRKKNGTQEVIRIRMGDVIEGELDKNIVLTPGDLISVPESFF